MSRPVLCYVTDRSALGSGSAPPLQALFDKVAAAVAAGVDWVQIREKDLSGRESAAVARFALHRASQLDRRSPASRILVNDRLDVALAEGAAGVHLGEQSLPVERARQLVAKHEASQFLIGASCHTVDAARAAANSGADYLFFGPIFETPSKSSFGPPQGLARLSEVCGSVRIPVLAIGGIDEVNATSCLAAGATGIAAIRLFQDAADLPALVRFLHALPLS